MANNPYNLTGTAGTVAEFSTPGWRFELRKLRQYVWIRATMINTTSGQYFAGFTLQIEPSGAALSGNFNLANQNSFVSGSQRCSGYLSLQQGVYNTVTFSCGAGGYPTGSKTVTIAPY
ncbi:MAG: hypothetical protein LBV30_02190 [Propionibacteriaceae bacterium]|jgi:hypothetical protein|nr:hypothetical protein [Propionibacteriaceae bacterium]